MDKAEMVENSFRKMTEKEFVDAIVSVEDIHRPVCYSKASALKVDRKTYVLKVRCAERLLTRKLDQVLAEFTPLKEVPNHRFLQEHVFLALQQVDEASGLVDIIGNGYKKLLNNKDDCDSRDKSRRLKVAALGCMYTVAMRCIPSLEYLHKLRQYLAQATEKDLEDDNACSTLTNNKHLALLAEEDCTVPCSFDFDIQNVTGFVCPETLRWLEEVEREHMPKAPTPDEVDSANLAPQAQEHKEHNLSTILLPVCLSDSPSAFHAGTI